MNRHTLTLKPRTQRTSEVSNGQWFLKNELDTMLGCWKKATGTLVYDPERYDFKKTHKAHTLIIELPRDDLDLYYQWHLRKKLGSWFDHKNVVNGTGFAGHDLALLQIFSGKTTKAA